jgi:hypothetical protein
MPLFQNSVLKKYLAHLDPAAVQSGYGAYTAYFHHPQIRENIRNAKEEQFQEGFLRELFVKILGYTINPEPDFNLTTELKNIKDSKKTDGAILKDGKALAVIELKGTDTKDLDKIRDQAFNYKNNQPECVYVLTSNFERLRFYIDNAVDFVEFNVLAMAAEDFRLLWLLLHRDQLLGGIPKKIKEESLLAEEQVTKQLYADYSAFKQELWQDMVAHNPGEDELTLYKKSQKLLDRFLFIFFAEDKGLLPPNSIMEIVAQWKHLGELDEYRPLYERFRKYFGYLNTGRVVPGKAEIHAYNGGLFAPDAVLDGLTISDAVLEKHVRKLTEYDFESEVDTNILGHIFEHSLNDIENVRAQLAGQEVDKSKTKRKRDGVFYTPKYITKYIVDNTLGRLCREKKEDLGIIDEEFAKGKAGRKKDTLQKLIGQLKTYREWLMQLAICDPACGSGAFLNQVLEFLMAEHHYLDELESMLFGSSIVFPNVEKHILENNIFGVDINEESVEIARLSLWLRTAKKGRKLSSLNANIKVGNSLIDDPAVAGDLAFDWAEQFPQVFDPSLRGTKQSGFDVVVGNPPYVRQELLPKGDKEYYKSTFKTVYTGSADLYVFFYIKAISILRPAGLLGFITPNKFIRANYGKGLRVFLAKTSIRVLIDFGELPVFADAATFPCILICANNLPNEDETGRFLQVKSLQNLNLSIQVVSDGIALSNTAFTTEEWKLNNVEQSSILDKMRQFGKELEVQLNQKIKYGIKTGFNEAFIIDGNKRRELIKEDSKSMELIKPFIVGDDVRRYRIDHSDKFILLVKSGTNIANYPAIHNHLMQFKDRLEERYDKGDSWFDLRACDYYNDFVNQKIVYPVIAKEPRFAIDIGGEYFFNDKAFMIPNGTLSILAILNSKLIWFYLKSVCSVLGDADNGGRLELRRIYLSKLPMPQTSKEDELLLHDAAKKINSQVELQFGLITKLIQLIQSKFSIDKPSTKLQNWPDLDFKGFLGELAKAKVKLSLSEEAEWMAYFNEQKAKAQALQSEITRIDKEIDALVYELYGLTEEEIRIVEGGE